MEHLSKQQLILLALLVSFVTSLSTGIVTVSLMDQAPAGVTQTVSQVIERTIQAAVPQDSSTASVAQAGDPTASAVSKVSASIVQLESAHSSGVTGLGLVVSKDGVIIADKTSIAGLGEYVAILPGGARIPVSVVQMQASGDIVFLAPSSATSSPAFVPIAFASAPKLGQTALALSGTSTPVLGQGIVTEFMPAGANADAADVAHISTTISGSHAALGSPLFATDGSVLGIATYTSLKNDGGEFYPIAGLKAVIPNVR